MWFLKYGRRAYGNASSACSPVTVLQLESLGKRRRTHPGSLVLTTRNEVRPIRAQLDIRNLLRMTVLHCNDLFTRLDLVFCDLAALVACNEVFG